MVVLLAESSDRPSSALNTFAQRPQRTYPWPARRSAAATASVSAHLGQTVNIVSSAASQGDPAFPRPAWCNIKPRRINNRYGLCLLRQDPGEQQLAPFAQPQRKFPHQHTQAAGENVGDQQVGPGGQARRVNILARSEEHTSELQSLTNLVCRLLLEKKKTTASTHAHCALFARFPSIVHEQPVSSCPPVVSSRGPASLLLDSSSNRESRLNDAQMRSP